mmetsp:Transcript_32998/g.72377  ORF Transcript_32998/g.72377 Transcript_32998/m.72377 type:complete len:100 (+) Transcript_32998:1134-1433(+)
MPGGILQDRPLQYVAGCHLSSLHSDRSGEVSCDSVLVRCESDSTSHCDCSSSWCARLVRHDDDDDNDGANAHRFAMVDTSIGRIRAGSGWDSLFNPHES